MIRRYSDHAANERTFLAWVRTAIAVMAFGFVIERFDLFLQVIASQRQPPINSPGSTFADAMKTVHRNVSGYALAVRAAIHTCGAEFCLERSLPAAMTSTPLGVVTSVAAGCIRPLHVWMITVSRSITPSQIEWPRYNHDRRRSVFVVRSRRRRRIAVYTWRRIDVTFLGRRTGIVIGGWLDLGWRRRDVSRRR